MNFLFITTLLILLFSLVSSSMTSSLKTTAAIAQNLSMKIERVIDVQNKAAKAAYNSTKQSSSKTDEARKTNRKDKEFQSRKGAHSASSTLNLYPLISDSFSVDQKNLVKQTLKNLIHILYEDEAFFQKEIAQRPNIVNDLVKEIALGLKKRPSLEKLTFRSTKTRDFYLTLCRGSYKAKKSARPLINFVTLQESEEPPLSFPYMSKELIEAFFGEKTMTKILEAEEKKYYDGKPKSQLTQTELGPLISEIHQNVHKTLITFKRHNYKKTQTHEVGKPGELIILGPPA